MKDHSSFLDAALYDTVGFDPLGVFDDADEEGFECFENHAAFLVRLLTYIGRAFAG